MINIVCSARYIVTIIGKSCPFVGRERVFVDIVVIDIVVDVDIVIDIDIVITSISFALPLRSRYTR